MTYFDNFQQILYLNMANPNAVMDGDFVTVRNIFERVGLLSSVVNNISLYYTYYVTDGDTPEIIASKYYTDPTKHWLVMFANLIIDPYWQWPKNSIVFEEYINQKYGNSVVAMQTTNNYNLIEYRVLTMNYQSSVSNTTTWVDPSVLSVDGVTVFPNANNPVVQVQSNSVVSFSDGSTVDVSKQLVWVSAYDYENQQNEASRNIKLIRAEYAAQIEQQLATLLGQ